MPSLFTHQELIDRHGQRLRELCASRGRAYDFLILPAGEQERFDAATLASIELACFTGVWEESSAFTRRFLGSTLQAPNLRWFHLPNAGVDHPVFERLLDKGVRLTTSSGATAEPIAQTAIGAMLALARGFPRWWAAQQRHEWSPHTQEPVDLRGQTMVVVGLGAIGNQIARLARAIGLRVVGVRRSPRRQEDHVDDMVTPAELSTWVTAADWLVLACPLTAETRGMIDAKILAALPRGAHVINVARGQVIDEAALITALRDQRLAGAYLDVFENEPLPGDSPLWDLNNVIISPHDSAASTGNSERVAEIFLRNLEHWLRDESLENEVRR